MPTPAITRRILVAAGAVALPALVAALDSGHDELDAAECIASNDPARELCPSDEEARRVLAAQARYDCEVRSATFAGFQDGDCCYTVEIHCVGIGCACAHGRPVRVRGQVRHAALSDRAQAWFDARLPAPQLSGLSRAERGRLAHYWASIALHEHASMPTFHRLARDLHVLGAPVALQRAARRGVDDERRHARLAFTLASHYAGSRLGPGRLARPRQAAATLTALARRNLREGCIEECGSLAAAVAMRRAASDPAVVRVLDTIVADETRHAELSWSILRWTLAVEPRRVRKALRGALARPSPPVTAADEPEVPAHGCLADSVLLGAAGAFETRVLRPLGAAAVREAGQRRV